MDFVYFYLKKLEIKEWKIDNSDLIIFLLHSINKGLLTLTTIVSVWSIDDYFAFVET